MAIFSSARRTTNFNAVMDIQIVNPKIYADGPSALDNRVFPYYAGYSSNFADKLISSLCLPVNGVVLDPWNGSGTTSNAGAKLGYHTIGLDLNPAMVLVAKSALVSVLDLNSLVPLAETICERAATCTSLKQGDPLGVWFAPASQAALRSIEKEINQTLVSHRGYTPLKTSEALERVTPLAAFFYVALFRVSRRLIADFIPTNPTWVKKPEKPQQRKRPSLEAITQTFISETRELADKIMLQKRSIEDFERVNLKLENAEKISLPTHSVDAVITSPPYCTRIDYAVATSIELAILQFGELEFDRLRRSLTGTSTVGRSPIDVNEKWGKSCLDFLAKVYEHPSKASKTYYFKNHIQYFSSMFEAISEISRVLKSDGTCVMVVQDSYYKDIHNDLPTILSEMADIFGLSIVRRQEFINARTMAYRNRQAKVYRSQRAAVESVLCFRRN